MIFSYIRTSKRTNWKVPRKASTAPYPDVSMLSQPSEISDSRLRREVIYNIQNNELKNIPHMVSTASYLDVSMLSQPSEISDFHLRREVIYNIEKNELKKFPAGLPQPLIRIFQCSLSRRKSLISAYGVRLL